jgi:ribosomal protein S20
MSESKDLSAAEADAAWERLKEAFSKIVNTSKEDVLKAEAAERDAKARATRKRKK